MRAIITVRHSRRATDVLIDADPATPMTRIVQAITAVLGRDTPELRRSGDPNAPTFSGGGLMDGAILTLGSTADADPHRTGRVEVRFVGGPASGRIVALAVGDTEWGFDDNGDTVSGSAIAPGCGIVSMLLDSEGTLTVRLNPDSRHPALLEGAQLTVEAVPLAFGEQLTVGQSVVQVMPLPVGTANLLPSEVGGWLDYNRPPRLLPPVSSNKFRLPAPPPAPTRNPLPWLAAAIPAVLGISMAVLMKQPFYLLFALMSPIMMIGTNLTARRNGKKTHRQQVVDHRATMAELHAEIDTAIQLEQRKRRQATPDAAELLQAATLPTRRLWERRVSDPDHLLFRVGTADLPSSVHLEDLAVMEHRRVSTGVNRCVPATLSLGEAGVIGIAGSADWPRLTGRWIIGQLAVLQSPRDLQIVILSSPEDAAHWLWSRWLPHLRPSLGQDAVALLGSDSESVGRRVAELGQLVAERTAASSEIGSGSANFTPDVLVVLDGARRLRALPGIVALLRDGPDVGIHLLCLDEEERQLPEECTAVIVERSEGTLLLRQHKADDLDGVRADSIVESWFDEIARALSPLRDVSVSNSDSLLPASANLLEVLDLKEPTGDAIVARWATGGRSTEAVIGVGLDGPFTIDLVRDGPHGLVAGTTGSGKSEFLQTLVASLAVQNRPDAMTFVLIDYKGGAAFSECADLPHTVGMVTDLDSHLVQRALNSLRAELIRREEMLGGVGAKDIEAYELITAGDGTAALPRLMIVIDEFAAMAKELPDFVAGLISIAQRGRSLGVHLIMATQRPSGVISPEIRANTNLRIALRMTDAGESSDVIDIADAARILKSTPGRAYARLGHASIIPFQTARVGGSVTRLAKEAAVRKPFVATLSAAGFAGAVPLPPVTVGTATTVTELSVLVAAIRSGSDGLGIPAQHSPWLPALTETVLIKDLPTTHQQVGWAREDLPAQQLQRDAVIDFRRFGHLYVVGAAGSGRSQALRTIAVSAALNESAADLHLYAIDCGNGALASLSALPHCGAVSQRNQTERSLRLVQRLQAEVLRRQELLGEGNFANVTEQRAATAAAERLPHILVLIDRWENFVTTLGELDSGAVTDLIFSMLRDGASAGVHLVIAGDRSLLASRMGALTDDKIVLRLTDRLDYSLADLNHKTIPLVIPAGRGFRASSGIEVQVAILGPDASGKAQAEAVRALGARLTDRDIDIELARRPFRVDDLPSSLGLEEALALGARESTGPMWALVGVGGDSLQAHGIDLEHDIPTFVVAGPSRSGRSTLLAAMADSLLVSGSEIVLVCPRSSPLLHFSGRPGVRAVITHADLADDDLIPHLAPDGTPVVLIIDDGELVMDAPARLWLRNYIRTASDNRRGLILGGNSAEICAGFSGWQVDLKKNRRGALLSPQNTVDGDLVGARVARSMVSPRIVPGRAIVNFGSGDFVTLQVPLRQTGATTPSLSAAAVSIGAVSADAVSAVSAVELASTELSSTGLSRTEFSNIELSSTELSRTELENTNV